MQMSAKKEHLNLVVVGHVDHGKSTLFGRLLFDLGEVDERTIQKFAEESEKMGRGDSFKFAWVLDRLKEERERGVTISLSFQKFETPKYFFTLIDAPGHRDFVKNMITGASQADCAILVVSAKKGEFEAGIGMGGQTREHLFLLTTLGIKQIIVAVNKMDDATVNWSKDRYEEIKNELSALMRKLGYDPSKIDFIPVSAWTGDNVVKPSDKMPWYGGPTLYEALDKFVPPPKPIDKPLRIPVQDVYSISGVGTVPVGRVETGVLSVGDTVIFMPSGKQGEVKSIETHHVRIEKAYPGDNIGFNVRGIDRRDIRRGNVAGHPDTPPTVAEEFIGQIIVIYHPTSIAPGYTPVMHVHTAQVATTLVEFISKLDPRSGAVTEDHPKFLKTGDAAIVRFRPLRPVALEEYSQIPQLGRFAIRDMGMTIAAGVVKEVTKITPKK